MAALERFLDKLTKRTIQEAVEGVRKPRSKDAYELGRLGGVQEGLAIAKTLFEESVKEDEQPDPDESPRIPASRKR